MNWLAWEPRAFIAAFAGGVLGMRAMEVASTRGLHAPWTVALCIGLPCAVVSMERSAMRGILFAFVAIWFAAIADMRIAAPTQGDGLWSAIAGFHTRIGIEDLVGYLGCGLIALLLTAISFQRGALVRLAGAGRAPGTRQTQHRGPPRANQVSWQTHAAPATIARAARNFALQDWVMLAYHVYFWARALLTADGPLAARAQRGTTVLVALTLLTLALTRGEWLRAGPTRALVYRVGMFGTMAASYFVLRPLLHALDPVLLDARLLELDRHLFGQTPAVWLEALVTPRTVEWFSYFYYSYYALLAVILGGTLLFDQQRRRYEVLFAAAIVVVVGHVGYTWVPGVGPYDWPGVVFSRPLEGGRWWHEVQHTVSQAGAQLDIFPSLHTALSLTVGLHALRHRRDAPFRWIWPAVVFFVANIVIATLFLRWHYGVDVVAGVALAVLAQRIAVACWAREGTRAPYQPVWEPMARA